MSLNDELKALRIRLEARRPPEVVATMHRAVDELRASGASARVLKVGALAPRFTLPNAEGGSWTPRRCTLTELQTHFGSRPRGTTRPPGSAQR
jgi:hypothetical protein